MSSDPSLSRPSRCIAFRLSARTPKDLEQIASIADGMPVGILLSSAPSGAFVYANRAFHEIFGVPPGPGVRVDFPAAFGIRTRDGALYPRDRLPFTRALREKVDVTIDDIIVHRSDGKRVAVRAFARPIFDSAGAIAYVVIAFTDITEEVEARARADLIERRMQHVLSRAPIILFSFDQRGTVTLSEGRGLDRLGYRPNELLGRSVFDIYADDPVALMNAYRVLEGEEFTVVNQVGSAALETTFTPVRGPTGEVSGAVGVSLDVTDRVAMQTRLLQAERLASMGTLSATVAHEINNPLTYVLGNLDLLASRLSEQATSLPAAGQLLQRVNQAREGADRVRRIVRGLQAFSRQDDDRAEPTDVHAALERALEMAENVIRHRARLVRHFGHIPPVLANDLRLGQVFVNLLLNAAQAIPEGHADSNEIRVRTWHDAKKNGVVVAIEDTGSGISPEVKARIFEPFYTTKPVGIGTGLGLSICYGIIDGFGGSIEVESALGKGATFSVRLPVSAVGPEGQAITQADGAQLRRGRLLIVDDDANVARSFALMLGVNHDVELSLEARAAARRILAGERFDVIFCDLMMPETTGMDFHAIIAAHVPDQAERIVFITGGAFTPEARAFVARATNTFLEKPFDMKELHNVLASYLQRKATDNI